MEGQIAQEKEVRRIQSSEFATTPKVESLLTVVDVDEEMLVADGSKQVEVRDSAAKASTSKFLEVYKWDEREGIVRRSQNQQPESQQVERDCTPVSPLTTHFDYPEKQAERPIQTEEGDEDFDLEGKEKRSIPAVMRCFDRAKIYIKAGDGGDGVVAFRREKFVPFGGPSGGNGGDGGSVYIQADTAVNSLLPFRRTVHFRGTRGTHGQGKGKSGATGEHCTVKVPVGTAVKKIEGNGDVLLELLRSGQRELLLPGGRGGRGNAAFKTGRNKTPQIAENGEEGAEMWLELELKLVADVGIIGVPNAGKSTLLSAISAARPEIANYPFTTLLPNLGVVDLGFDASMVVADLPGLLEGAHTGYGLGHEFLRHTERCRVLVHVVDGMSQQAQYEYEAVRLELQLFNPELEHKPFLVAYNKMDVPEAAERWEGFQDFMKSKGVKPFCMSAATRTGTDVVTKAAYELAKERMQTELADETQDEAREQNVRSVGDMVRRQRSAPIEDFTVSCDKHTRTWQIDGAGLRRFTQMTNWEYFEAVRRFQHVLNASGVSKALREHGVKEGDTVIVGELEFNWIDSDDMRSLGEWKRGVRGSKVWPH
eukprot:TRINITY_DN7722_c0_g1_i2.p1 TRINITY_DN7722_c0_g1~~TRINITY_DN7722_c0_g1_i2.p1  ORF type:complete len:652 (-),score=147.08 TRINITY_DN7722_c0_g1_i2:329-2113(-)